MEFEIAKKIEKVASNVKGNSLRSIKADKDAAQMIIVADTYGDIKSGVENYRMVTNCDITFRMRGKSIDVSVMAGSEGKDALALLMEFAKTISFNSEDANDVVEFLSNNMPLPGCEFKEIELDQNRLRLIMTANEENFSQEAVMEKLDPYNMGIVK